MRLFLAIDVDEPTRAHLRQACDQIRRENWRPPTSWVKPENYHVTLKFLGEVPEEQAPQLQTALSTVRVERPLRLTARNLVLFPPRGRINVIAAGLGGDVQQVQSIYDEIEAACAPLGFERERRRFAPHITLARCRGGLSADRRRLTDLPLWPGPTFESGGFCLIRSRLNPKGSIYETIRQYPVE